MNYGIIDIGSNTIRIVVYKITKNRFECLFNKKQFVQLIGYVKNGRMRDEGKRSMILAVKQLAEIAQHFNPKRIDCFATAPFRAVDNADELIGMIKNFTGLKTRVLSGEEEAQLELIGAQYLNGTKTGLFVDLGGGSLEAGLLENGEIKHAQSINIGCVNLTDGFVSGLFPTKQELKRLKTHIDEKLGELSWLHEAAGFRMICTGGTARALGELHQSLTGSTIPLDAYSMDAKEIKSVYKTIIEMETEGLRLISKQASGRIFTFVPGTVALWRIAKTVQAKQVSFSTYGVREGFLIKYILGMASGSILAQTTA